MRRNGKNNITAFWLNNMQPGKNTKGRKLAFVSSKLETGYPKALPANTTYTNAGVQMPTYVC